jgi:hypothetical protein
MPLGEVPLVECTCWDKDRWGKDYMGELDIAVEDIFANGKLYQEVRQVYVSLVALLLICGSVAQMVQTKIESQRQQEEHCLWRSSNAVLPDRYLPPHSDGRRDIT